MAHFLYISDVFCPWCYGFAKNIAKIKQEFGLPFEVYAGALVEPAVSLENRLKHSPNVQAFIDKMYSVTGTKISQAHVELLHSDNAFEIFMDSRKGSHLFYVLKQFKPEFALEIMEFLQRQFYDLGRDIFSAEIVHDFAEQYAVSSEAVFAMLKDEKISEDAYNETEKGFDILGEIVLYPTLYYVDEGTNHFISRGFVEYEACRQAVLNTIEAVKNKQMQPLTVLMGKSCTLDGKCE